ncbi:MAG: hypothetical protein U1D29_16205 [Burkholderiales bacterium]|nr:hypothetical protein [Burkholderiales bacterium]
MSLLIAQFQKFYPCQTYIFDKDHSMALMSVLLGGQHIDMVSPKSSGARINPARRMLRNGHDRAFLKWIDVLLASNGTPLTGEDQETVSAAIQQMKSLGEHNWRLGTLYSLISGSDKRLAIKIAPYVDRSDQEGSFAKGAFSEFFDHEDDSFSLGQIVCMETGKLLQSEQVAAPFMDYVFYCIDQQLDGQTPTLIYVEEAWYMLANPTFEEKVNDWLRTFRKKRAFVIFATQSPEELRRLKAWPAFVANVPTRIFLPSINDSVSALTPIYRELFNLNDAQLQLLSAAVPKRDYLIVKPGMTRLVEAQLPEVVIAINEGTTRREIRDAAFELLEHGDGDWQIDFLTEKFHVG